ncbi:MAG: TetR/AcrR family transcriptional regulator [Cytophagaceae bacterium]|jgi:AcrR family transcriptional regulator|nr:TetR/AcrR family transcriptional regulator [Cytophagaceae bacterium]
MDRTILKIRINESLYLRDPQETELGRKIFSQGIRMIEELGLEKFTFKKLAERIESTEASIYRYFENKNMFLLYLTSWFWVWMDFKVQFAIQNISDPKQQLKLILRTLVESHKEKDTNSPDEQVLHRIILIESPKSYLIKEVDEFNKEGGYREFKKFCLRISDLLQQINPEYAYPNSLASSVVEMSMQQEYFSNHLPSLSSLAPNNTQHLLDYLEHVVFGLLESKN